MDGGERAYQEHHRYMLETGQWATENQPPQYSQPVPPALADNPISDRMAKLAAQEAMTANAFNLEQWKQDRGLPNSLAVYDVSDHSGDYTKAIRDLLQHAPANRMVPVWLYPVSGGKTLLLDRSPTDAPDRYYLNVSSGLAHMRIKKRYKAAIDLLQRENKPAKAFTLRGYPFSYDGDTGRYFDNGSTFFILPDGKRWTASGMTVSLTPQRLVERSIAWLTGAD